MGKERLTLKWGTIKGWHFPVEGSGARILMEHYLSSKTTLSAMMTEDTTDEKKLICDIIDALDGEICNDWTGYEMSKDEAKAYVMEYGK